jgi:NOL1/NOP2/sun family putative RNA methylase
MEKDIIDFPSTSESKRLAKQYGYNEFIVRRFLNLFENGKELIEAMESTLPTYIRINTLKKREETVISLLEERGFSLKETPYSYMYEVVDAPYSPGATPEYLMGYYYIQDASSAIPPLALEPNKQDVVVDMCAAPGGKTTFLAQLMNNEGVIIAAEINRERINSLIHNIHRCGVINTLVMKVDAKKLPEIGIMADKVLLDAPCTGEGIIHKDPSRKTSRDLKDLIFCSTMQRELVDSALKLVKKGGIIVYSTCSLAPEENEMVVQYVIDNYPVRLEEVSYGSPALLKAGKYEFSRQMKKAKRFFPHIHKTSGFFVARIRVTEEIL